MKATVLDCTLKRPPDRSNTEALARVVVEALERDWVECELIRIVDLEVPPGVQSDEGDGDEWPGVRERILVSEILLVASPTWLGRPSSVAKRRSGADGRDAVGDRTTRAARSPTTAVPGWS